MRGHKLIGVPLGLALTNDKKLVTIRSSGPQPKIVLFSATVDDQPAVAEFDYQVSRVGTKRPSPSFLDAYRDRICVTDLGQ